MWEEKERKRDMYIRNDEENKRHGMRMKMKKGKEKKRIDKTIRREI